MLSEAVWSYICLSDCCSRLYIHVLQMTRENLGVVVGVPAVVSHFKQLHRGGVVPTVYYDTTFSMGDFYVSALLFRHDVFDGAPIQPLLLLIHERRSTDSHELLFSWFRRVTGVQTVVCVADHEQAITNAVKNALPGSEMIYCWNHILNDIRVSFSDCSYHITSFKPCPVSLFFAKCTAFYFRIFFLFTNLLPTHNSSLQ